jgi:hypothetical protein
MLPKDVVLFGITVSLALIMLFTWRRRRTMRRLNRGLRGYMAAKPVETAHEEKAERLIVV